MPVEGFRTVEEQRAFVYEYLSMPYGSKCRFLAERGVTEYQLYRWRSQVFADSIEQGLVPRSESVSLEDVAALKRLLEENRGLRKELSERDARHDREIAARDKDLAGQRRAVDALGKAIEILQARGAGKNSESAVPPGSSAVENQ